jgi:transcriptional regulator with XRE-family HTH domain
MATTAVKDSSDLAQQMRARRKNLRLTQQDLADLSGVSARAIFNLEKNSGAITSNNLLTLVRVLGLEIKLEVAPNG